MHESSGREGDGALQADAMASRSEDDYDESSESPEGHAAGSDGEAAAGAVEPVADAAADATSENDDEKDNDDDDDDDDDGGCDGSRSGSDSGGAAGEEGAALGEKRKRAENTDAGEEDGDVEDVSNDEEEGQ